MPYSLSQRKAARRYQSSMPDGPHKVAQVVSRSAITAGAARATPAPHGRKEAR